MKVKKLVIIVILILLVPVILIGCNKDARQLIRLSIEMRKFNATIEKQKEEAKDKDAKYYEEILNSYNDSNNFTVHLIED